MNLMEAMSAQAREQETFAAGVVARLAHKGHEWHGEPFFELHVLPFVDRVKYDTENMSFECVSIAFLWNAIMAGLITNKELMMVGFSPPVVSTLDVMTPKEDEDDIAFIARLAEHPAINLVLIHERRERVYKLDEQTEECKRYRRELRILEGYNEHNLRTEQGIPSQPH